MEYLSRFDFDIQYVKGTSNKVADSLSRYYQSNTSDDMHKTYDYVNVDLVLDPGGEDLPWNRIVEIRAISNHLPRLTLREAVEERGIQAKVLAKAATPEVVSPPAGSNGGEDPTVFASSSNGPELTKFVEKAEGFLDKVRKGYNDDPLFSKIISNMGSYPTFTRRGGLVYTHN